MSEREKHKLGLISEYFEKFQKFQIQMCAYRHPEFKDYMIFPAADRHFKHLFNEICQMVEGKNFQENLSNLYDFSLFTPKYSKENFDFILVQGRVEKICETCIAHKDFSECIFNVFIQVLISQKPRRSLKMIHPVLEIYKNSDINSTWLKQLCQFYTMLQNIENDSQARVLIYALNYYLTFRDESQFVSKLSSCQFSHILKMIFEKLTSFPNSLFHIIKYDPFIFSFLECEECSNIDISQIPPFSLVLQSGEEVPKSFFMRYREIFLEIINMFLIFSKSYFTAEERVNLTAITSNVLNYVESGPVGRDAFIFILLHFLRSDFLRKNAEIFFQYIAEGEIKIPNNDKEETKKSDSFINIPRFNTISILVFSIDTDIFPSTISLICNDYCKILITNTLKKIIDHFPDSPFKEKTQSVFAKLYGYPKPEKSICERATQITYQIWKNGLVDSNRSEAANLLIDLSQKRPNILISECSAVYVDPSNMKYFLQLALAFFSKNKYTQAHFTFYSYIASILLPLANTNTPRKVDHQLINENSKYDEKKYHITNSDSKYPFHFYFNVDGPDKNCNNIFFNLPRWHLFSIQRELILTKMVESIDLMKFLVRMNQSLTPSLFLGSTLIFSKIIQKDDPRIKKIFSNFSTHNFTFLAVFFQKATLYELPEITRELMRLMENCPKLSIDSIQCLTNALISTGKNNGYRTFIRFLAPLFRNEHYVQQIIDRDYYLKIVEKFLEFTDDPQFKKDELVTSLSFIYFWRVLGTFPNMQKIEPKLQELVFKSISNITGHENEDLFYKAFFELIITHGIQLLIDVMTNIDDSSIFSSSYKLVEMLLKLPKKMIDEIKINLTQTLKDKVSTDILNLFNNLKTDDENNELTVKWVPWPIDDFVYEVTGLDCRCDSK